MKTNSQVLFLLAAIFFVCSLVWFIRQNNMAAIGCLAAAVVELVVGLILWRKSKGEKR